MKLIIDQSRDYEDVEITIKFKQIDADLEKLIAQIRLYGFAIIGKKDGAIHPLRPEEIYYFESIDDKTFAYCEKEVFDCSLKLYELEQQLAKADFVRISKSCIMNIAKLSNVRALMNGRFEARLQNGEKLIINRHYVPGFKEKFNF